MSKTNTTLGFIKVYLPEIHRLYEFRDKFFIDGSQTILTDKEIESLETFYDKFEEVCQFGVIGLKSLEPKKLRLYLPKKTLRYAQGKVFNFNNESDLQFINY